MYGYITLFTLFYACLKISSASIMKNMTYNFVKMQRIFLLRSADFTRRQKSLKGPHTLHSLLNIAIVIISKKRHKTFVKCIGKMRNV
jgi:hypothetical protein